MNKIFIVEDDAVIAKSVADHLEKWDMKVEIVQDLKCVDREVERSAPDLILMDISLPFYNGFYWCSEIRKTRNTPIVFLSSMDDNMNIVMAMNMGGDDFIAKPFDLNVLTAKIQAMLRRSYGMDMTKNELSHGSLLLDLNDMSVRNETDKQILTKNEFLIFKTLLEKEGSVVSREDLMERLWGNDEFIDENTLTVNITRIRKKLEILGYGELIETKRGMGYIIEK